MVVLCIPPPPLMFPSPFTAFGLGAFHAFTAHSFKPLLYPRVLAYCTYKHWHSSIAAPAPYSLAYSYQHSHRRATKGGAQQEGSTGEAVAAPGEEKEKGAFRTGNGRRGKGQRARPVVCSGRRQLKLKRRLHIIYYTTAITKELTGRGRQSRRRQLQLQIIAATNNW
jgi:hypothetical protein